MNRVTIIIILLFYITSSFLLPNVNPKFIKKHLGKSWTQLSRTDEGFVIYKPCDGQTPQIKIAGNKLEFFGQIEPSEEYKIEHSYTSGNVLTISCNNSALVVNVKRLDKNKTTALWKCSLIQNASIRTFKIVMCPENQAHKFKVIDNPCPNGKIPEKQFLPIEDIIL